MNLHYIINANKYYFNFEYSEKVPKDFNFIAKINSTDLILDTYKNEFSKGITWEKDTVISYKLSNSEKQRIYEIMKKIDIVNILAPNKFGVIF